jgi:hypothetical protein
MKTFLAMVTCCSAALLTSANGFGQNEPWWNGAPDSPAQKAPAQQPPAPPPPPVQARPQPQPTPQAEPAPQSVAPPPTVHTQPQQPQPTPQAGPPQYPPSPQVTEQMAAQGEWVYTAQDGWMWVPYGSTTTNVGVEPYVYLFSPSYGWRWLVSPWGLGPFHYGAWGWGPRWGNDYAPPRGLGAFQYAPHVWGRGAYTPRAYGGGVRAALPARVGGAHYAGSGGFAGGHAGGAHSGGGHHR